MLDSDHTEYFLTDYNEDITQENKGNANKIQTWSDGCHAESALGIPSTVAMGVKKLGIPHQKKSKNHLFGIAAICSFQHAI